MSIAILCNPVFVPVTVDHLQKGWNQGWWQSLASREDPRSGQKLKKKESDLDPCPPSQVTHYEVQDIG